MKGRFEIPELFAFSAEVLKTTATAAEARGLHPGEACAAMMIAIARMMAMTAKVGKGEGEQVWNELFNSPVRDLFVIAYDAQFLESNSPKGHA